MPAWGERERSQKGKEALLLHEQGREGPRSENFGLGMGKGERERQRGEEGFKLATTYERAMRRAGSLLW